MWIQRADYKGLGHPWILVSAVGQGGILETISEDTKGQLLLHIQTELIQLTGSEDQRKSFMGVTAL